MTIRDHRNQAKTWSYGRAQLAANSAAAPWAKGRTKRQAKRVKAAQKDNRSER